jgi:hypothetical protein
MILLLIYYIDKMNVMSYLPKREENVISWKNSKGEKRYIRIDTGISYDVLLRSIDRMRAEEDMYLELVEEQEKATEAGHRQSLFSMIVDEPQDDTPMNVDDALEMSEVAPLDRKRR